MREHSGRVHLPQARAADVHADAAALREDLRAEDALADGLACAGEEEEEFWPSCLICSPKLFPTCLCTGANADAREAAQRCANALCLAICSSVSAFSAAETSFRARTFSDCTAAAIFVSFLRLSRAATLEVCKKRVRLSVRPFSPEPRSAVLCAASAARKRPENDEGVGGGRGHPTVATFGNPVLRSAQSVIQNARCEHRLGSYGGRR